MASTLNLNTQTHTHTHTLLSQRPGLQSNSFVKGNPASAAASDTMAVQKEVRDQVVFSSFLNDIRCRNNTLWSLFGNVYLF